MLTNQFRIARVQKSLRWFEEDVPLLNMRVKELSAERQESARRFAAAVIDQTRAELEKLLREQAQDNPQFYGGQYDGHSEGHPAGEFHGEPAD